MTYHKSVVRKASCVYSYNNENDDERKIENAIKYEYISGTHIYVISTRVNFRGK